MVYQERRPLPLPLSILSDELLPKIGSLLISGLEAKAHIAGSFKEILEVLCSKSSM
jgi:hypothetical protein